MMLAHATAKYIRISPYNIRRVLNLVRRKSVPEALGVLHHLNLRSARPVRVLLESAVANARHLHPEVPAERLYVAQITADEGPMWKRFRAAAMGRATRIRRRTVHLRVDLDARTGRLPAWAQVPPAAPSAPKKKEKAAAAAASS